MMPHPLVLARQSLNWFEEIRNGFWDLWVWFNRALRDGTIAWVLLIVAAILIYQRFFRRR